MQILLVLTFVKLLSVAFLLAGTLGAVMAREHADRRRFAHFVAGPAFGVTWIAGMGLLHLRGYSFFQVWVLASMVLSLISLHGAMFSASKPHRRTPLNAAIALVPFLIAFALMVWRPA